ncbi:hypothetical protein [Pseudomonas sp. TE3-3-F2023]|uniref:hypothetical protein n=1 Tax=Pseudomonas sp. TE3-3-F2023 TaxID=3119004 RepID=UPI0030D3B9E0
MKRTLKGRVEAGEPLMRQALRAIRDAQAAEAFGLAKHEVERLQLLADWLYEAQASARPGG